MSCEKISVQSVSQIWTLHYSLLSEEPTDYQTHLNLENPRHTNFMQGLYTPIKMGTIMSLMNQILMNHSVYR